METRQRDFGIEDGKGHYAVSSDRLIRLLDTVPILLEEMLLTVVFEETTECEKSSMIFDTDTAQRCSQPAFLMIKHT
jgi:hypothetical protein